jgi:hypothetical protein
MASVTPLDEEIRALDAYFAQELDAPGLCDFVHNPAIGPYTELAHVLQAKVG